VVLLDGDIVPVPERSGFDTVEIDNYEAGYRLARHMLQNRPKATVAFVSTKFGTHAGELRWDGIRHAAADFGGRAALLRCDPDDRGSLTELLRKARTNAVICSHDALSVHVMAAFRAIGKNVPQDTLLASFDDTPVATALDPPLTVIRQSSREIARMAFSTLMQRIAKPHLPAHRVILEAPLVVRASTTPPKKAKPA
ncbi:MAG: substrate-binding domain-containing protein, partial [Kiritimatiellae bacterium]|nr:substrate-binding domain-containing protein [Kiritimatiellia bacterium]